MNSPEKDKLEHEIRTSINNSGDFVMQSKNTYNNSTRPVIDSSLKFLVEKVNRIKDPSLRAFQGRVNQFVQEVENSSDDPNFRIELDRFATELKTLEAEFNDLVSEGM